AEPSGATSLSYQPDSVCQIRHAVAAEATRPSDQRTDPGDKPLTYASHLSGICERQVRDPRPTRKLGPRTPKRLEPICGLCHTSWGGGTFRLNLTTWRRQVNTLRGDEPRANSGPTPGVSGHRHRDGRLSAALPTPAPSATAAATSGSMSAALVPSPSAISPAVADPSDCPTMRLEPSIVMTVVSRPAGLCAAPKLYCVTSVGPTPMPTRPSATAMAGTDPAVATSTLPATMIPAKTSHRHRGVNRAGRIDTASARTADPMPITPYITPALSPSPLSVMNDVNDVSVVPKNTPTPSMPTTITRIRARKSSRTGDAGRPLSSRAALRLPVGCSANAHTKPRARTAAATSDAHGAMSEEIGRAPRR